MRKLYDEDFVMLPEYYDIKGIDDVVEKMIGTDENPEIFINNCLNENAMISSINISADIDEDDILTWKTNYVEMGEGTRNIYVRLIYKFDVEDCDSPVLMSYEVVFPPYELPFEYVPLKQQSQAPSSAPES